VHVREHQVYGCAVVGFESSDDAHRVVEKAVSEIRGEGVGATGRVVRTIIGHVPAAILREADDVDADEIIIDSQRAGALLRRRTTQRLLRRSWLPWSSRHTPARAATTQPSPGSRACAVRAELLPALEDRRPHDRCVQP
jgi:hypothetical protein